MERTEKLLRSSGKGAPSRAARSSMIRELCDRASEKRGQMRLIRWAALIMFAMDIRKGKCYETITRRNGGLGAMA